VAVSTAFGLLSAATRISCAAGTALNIGGEAISAGAGLLGLAGWMLVLTRWPSTAKSFGGVAAGFVVVAVVFAFPAFATTFAFSPQEVAARADCGESSPVDTFTAAGSFLALATCLVAFGLLRSSASAARVASASAISLVLWVVHVIFVTR